MLDVIVTSTCRKTIEQTLRSFLKNVHTQEAFHFIVHIDVLHVHYLKKVINIFYDIKKTGKHKVSIKKNMVPESNVYRNHSNALRYLFSQTKSKYYFHLEDDMVFLKKVNLDPLIQLMDNHTEINQIRFSKEKIREKSWLYYLYEEVTEESLANNEQYVIDNIPLVRVPTWAFNPHIGRTAIIKKFIDIDVDSNPEKYFCQKLSEYDLNRGIYVYGRIGDRRLVRDIGRNKFRLRLLKIKYILKKKKNAEYLFEGYE